MVPSLKKVDPVSSDETDDSMLLGDAPGPDSRPETLQGFGFTDARERVTGDSLDKRKDAQRYRPIGLNPVAKILAELGMEDGFATGGAGGP